MKNLNCLIVDDEELARTLIATYIEKTPGLTLVGQCSQPLEAMEYLSNQSIDLLFLDIQMPEMTGIEFIKTMKDSPLIVLTTAYSEYALESYELDVLDYLLKPFSLQRFLQTIQKAQARINVSQDTAPLTTPSPSSKTNYILVKADHKVHRLLLDDIIYIQSMREYVAYYTQQGKILSLGSLKQLEHELPSHQFIRVHKSYMVAISKVTTLEGNMIHIHQEKIPIGASYREKVIEQLF